MFGSNAEQQKYNMRLLPIYTLHFFVAFNPLRVLSPALSHEEQAKVSIIWAIINFPL